MDAVSLPAMLHDDRPHQVVVGQAVAMVAMMTMDLPAATVAPLPLLRNEQRL